MMAQTDQRIDLYISKSADFAKPILTELREIVHKACPEATETIKWGFPHFEYHDSILCSMASFKAHCSFGFWLGSQINDTEGVLLQRSEKIGMGHLGKITSLKDLPTRKTFNNYIKQVMKLIDAGATQTKKPATKGPKTIEVPEDLAKALKKNKKAEQTFQSFSYTNKKEYVEWITSAKTGATRNSRLETAVEWMSEGKIRNWKYAR